jgi:hypothetical protein
MKKTIQIITLILFATILAFSGNKKIVVDLAKQEAYAYEGKTLIYKGWVSSGRKKFATPSGRYRVLAKEEEHISNEWPKPDGGAKMPYMLRLTWSGIALHLGYTPNRPASHGCVRLKDGFAQKLFKWAKVGTRVIIKGKAPRRVARRGRGFTDYVALAKLKKSKKRARIAKRVSKREKLVRYYSKFSHKRLNRILRKSSAQKRWLVKYSRYSKKSKLRKLRKIKRLVSIIRAAKNIKYKRYHHKRVAKKLNKAGKKLSLKSKIKNYYLLSSL